MLDRDKQDLTGLRAYRTYTDDYNRKEIELTPNLDFMRYIKVDNIVGG
ncbi:MAG: hypothetical protein VB098_12960 [Petrimonas sp.]|nr:hypothetical protein [Petrimonas sp.]MEA4980785.1 hypothetical protein [Petrimonas sp.]MEA5064095.1 hypothetical protein [Petrimonas sp.]